MEDLSLLTREERKERVLRKIEELGIIHVADVETLEDFETVIECTEEFEKDYPNEYMAFSIGLTEKTRNLIWTLEEKYQRIYFDILHKFSHYLWMEGKLQKKEIEELMVPSAKKFVEIVNKLGKKSLSEKDILSIFPGDINIEKLLEIFNES